ncbi:MAG: hypothetical protein AAF827_17295 [Cyanobacteria bacterium P01_D01_bin.6]
MAEQLLPPSTSVSYTQPTEPRTSTVSAYSIGLSLSMIMVDNISATMKHLVFATQMN